MRVVHRWTMGKQVTEPHLNEDASSCSNAKGIYALSDGASESFASKRWAQILVSRFIRRPAIDHEWLHRAIGQYYQNFDRATMTWSAQASFDRGSFATLLGLRVDPSGVSIVGIGDSLAVLDDGSDIRSTFPYNEAQQFRSNPLLLSTIHERNDAVFKSNFTEHWSVEADSKIYCMTDGLGAWLLSDRVDRMAKLRALNSRSDFVALVESARSDRTMARDDTTLVVLK